MKSSHMALATIAIWIITMTTAAVVTDNSNANGGEAIGIFVAAIIAGVVGTKAIWDSAAAHARSAIGGRRRGKAKRASIDRLLNALSEDDLYELRQRLGGDEDDEAATTLEDLLEDYEQGRH